MLMLRAARLEERLTEGERCDYSEEGLAFTLHSQLSGVVLMSDFCLQYFPVHLCLCCPNCMCFSCRFQFELFVLLLYACYGLFGFIIPCASGD